MRQPNAALVLGLFRRLVVSVAQAAITQAQTKKTRWTVRRYQQRSRIGTAARKGSRR